MYVYNVVNEETGKTENEHPFCILRTAADFAVMLFSTSRKVCRVVQVRA